MSSSSPALGDPWAMIADLLLDGIRGTDADSIAGWINHLKSDRQGERLVTCLCIDLKCGALDRKLVRQLILTIDFVALSDQPAFAFHRALKTLRAASPSSALGDGYCRSELDCPVSEGQRYVNVMRIQTFIYRYAGPTRGFTSSPRAIEAVEGEFFSQSERSLGDITKTNPDGNIWLCPHPVFESLRRSPDTLRDALGLALPAAGGTLVAVLYPPDCVKARQPTALDATWDRPGRYLSRGKSSDKMMGWGATHPWSRAGAVSGSGGEQYGVPERVHQPLTHLDASFTCTRVGEVKDVPEDERFLTEQMRLRFQQFTR